MRELRRSDNVGVDCEIITRKVTISTIFENTRIGLRNERTKNRLQVNVTQFLDIGCLGPGFWIAILYSNFRYI